MHKGTKAFKACWKKMSTMQKEILSQKIIQYKLERLALEVVENLANAENEIILLGIKKNGYVIAQKVAALMQPYFKQSIVVSGISLNKQHPDDVQIDNPVTLNDKHIVVVDDVANTGRTLMYALKPLLQQYPKSIQTMVLIDRMHKLFPVKPDYVGLSVATTLQEHISVEMNKEQIVGAYLL